jgi:ATP-dependent Lon protease
MTEVNKLKLMPPMSAEATVSRNYIDCMIKVPWEKHSDIQNDINLAETILNEDHYGLEKVKERILEYLAVQQRVRKLKGPILCLVGPPGVGKTSLGQSIARATERKFVRMSLGGVRDEAEIRGHRRTYIGALPGKIIQKLSKAEVNNPLFLLDEIDKMAMDFRGDPASALLEVLDPEQNKTFNDHYLEVDYDLSDVLFVATANTLDIPPALLDRMEVIRLSGYTEDEKLNIATHYLIPKQMEHNGVAPEEFGLSEAAIRDIIRYYTREAGVRNLERELSKLCRKIVKKCLSHPKAEGEMVEPVVLGPEDLEQYLGVRRFRFGQTENYDQVGQVTGLAWTEVGGEILTIEAVAVPGKGKVTTTGKLGEVMQESIQAAVTVVRSRAQALGIPVDFYEKQDIHVHVPEGGIPKDGPSAGISMVTALVSMLTGIPVHKEVAMTGEITLRGQVLPIGGLKEKLLAARRAGIVDVIIPDENVRELKEIAATVYEGMNIHPVRWIDEVLAIALTRLPLPSPAVELKEVELRHSQLVDRRKK